MLLFGKFHTKTDVLRRIGDIGQLASATPSILTNGSERGVEAIEVRAPELRFTVLPGRGLDITTVDYCGIPIAWRSSVGDTHSSFFDPSDTSWLRSFSGGMLTTCGLSYAGAPCEDNGKRLGLHGRASNLPARNVSVCGEWQGDDYCITIRGEVRESAVFGESLSLTRTIGVTAGEAVIRIEDAVENRGFSPAEHMMIYHCNFGFPLIDAETLLCAPSEKIEARNSDAQRGLPEQNRFSVPKSGIAEECFYHTMKPEADGFVTAALENSRLGLRAFVRYRKAELPEFIQWKMLREGMYVTGLEPANCRVDGRTAERGRKTLVTLAPGEVKHYQVFIGIARLGSARNSSP